MKPITSYEQFVAMIENNIDYVAFSKAQEDFWQREEYYYTKLSNFSFYVSLVSLLLTVFAKIFFNVFSDFNTFGFIVLASFVFSLIFLLLMMLSYPLSEKFAQYFNKKIFHHYLEEKQRIDNVLKDEQYQQQLLFSLHNCIHTTVLQTSTRNALSDLNLYFKNIQDSIDRQEDAALIYYVKSAYHKIKYANYTFL